MLPAKSCSCGCGSNSNNSHIVIKMNIKTYVNSYICNRMGANFELGFIPGKGIIFS